ncbi:orcokinin peptides type B-like isoform X3 [Daktulosphaira vitifoliae]|uniref:orcokinin peptides type B-like isoform X3 n=1 Tax=Daktulosphaira vitifoliae TaxID=58002 RepID=UPI0021AA34BF|nr:orcokinin peptides type B-like isoform X3 [Daktulosphaira vitifoliae]
MVYSIVTIIAAMLCVHVRGYPTMMERLSSDNSFSPLRSTSTRDLERFIEGENLLRDLEILRDRAEYFARQSRQINSLNGVGFGQSKRFDTLSGVSFGGQKRNMDEIDRTAFNAFIKKKNFDEIDRSGGIDRFVKKNFDEIDRSAFSSFVKRPNEVPAANLE